MKKQRLIVRTIILLILGGAIAFALYANFTKDDLQKIEVGKKVPDFSLVDLNGEQHKLSDYKGKGVFLNFWATYCGPCEREMPFMNSQYLQYKDKDVTVLAVNIGESDLAVKKYTERLKLEFPILLDSEGEVNSTYGVVNLPATYLIDKDGKLVKVHTGQLREEDVKDFMEQIKP